MTVVFDACAIGPGVTDQQVGDEPSLVTGVRTSEREHELELEVGSAILEVHRIEWDAAGVRMRDVGARLPIGLEARDRANDVGHGLCARAVRREHEREHDERADQG